MELRYLGHSCFYFKIGQSSIIVDPFISANPLAQHIDIENIKVDYLLITHGHSDHIGDADRLQKNNPDMYCIGPYEVLNYLGERGLSGMGMNIGGKLRLPFGSVRMVSASHSSRLPDGRYGGSPSGYVINTGSFCFYIAGDTGLSADMKIIPEICPPLHFAILPVGDIYTMGYEDACIAAKWIQCKTIFACHFDTFEEIKINTVAARNHFANNGINLILPTIGETLTF